MPLLTITAPGTYVVTADYTASSVGDAAILVTPNVPFVNIILHSRLVCPVSLPTNRANAAILFQGNNNSCSVIGMGGRIRGFGYGVATQGSGGFRAHDLNVDDALIRGVLVLGDDALVRDCLIKKISGSTLAPTQFCMGVEIQGARPKVIGNVVEDVYGTGPEPNNGEGVGISISEYGVGGVVKGNVVRNSRKQPKSIGYWVGGSSNVSLVHNHAENMAFGAAVSSPTSGMADENTFRNCTENFVDSGGDWTVGGQDG